MAQHTITTTVLQEEALAFYVGRGQAPDTTAFLQQLVSPRLDELAASVKRLTSKELSDRVRQITDLLILDKIAVLLTRENIP